MRPLPIRIVAALTSLVFAAWTCGPGVSVAHAASGPSVAVVGVHGNGEQSADELRTLTEDVVKGLTKAGLDVRSGSSLGALLRPERDRLLEGVYLAPVSRAFEEGRILYEKAQPEQAIDALERAWAALGDNAEFLKDGRLRVDVPLYLGLARISLGDSEGAAAAFADVVRADSAKVLDSLDYPPNITELFDRVRADLLAAELASLSVQTAESQPARVFLDGRLVGTAPLGVENLPPGDHTLLIDGSTAGRYFETMDLAAGASVEVDADLRRLGLARSDGDDVLPARSSLTRRLYSELGTTTGADTVAVAGFDSAGDFQLALYSARSETFSVAVVASLSAAPGARSSFVQGLAERLAAYVDDSGGIKPERVASEAIPLRLGGNPVLNDLVLGSVVVAVAGGEPPQADTPTVKKKGPHPGGIVALIVGGLLAGAGAGVGIWALTKPPVEQTGALVIELP
jgi:hypothetical protein